MPETSWLSALPDWATTNLPAWALDAITYLEGIWNEGAYGFTYGQIIIVVSILLLSLIVRGFFARTIVRGITRAAAGTKTRFDDALVKAIATPLKVVPVIIGIYIALRVVEVDGNAEVYSNKVMQSIVTLAVFWTLARAVNAFEFVFTALRDSLSPAVVDWMIKLLQVLIVVLGFGAVAQQWGIAIAPLLAGLGVFGIAIGLGAQDLFKNLISGILIISEKRFVPGEWIQADGVVEGTVEKINFRSTLVRRFDKSPVYVPNGLLSDTAVTNFSRMTHRRIKWAIGVEYRTTVDQLKFIRDEIEGWLWNDDRFAVPPEAPLYVRIDNFNASSIDFIIYCFTHSKRYGDWLEIKEDFALAIIDIIDRAGTGMAFPSRTLYMQQQDPPEIMPVPALSPGAEKARREIAETRQVGGMGDADDDG